MTDPSLSLDFPPTPTEDWHDRLRRDLGDGFMETLTWQPLEGIDLRAFYRRADTEALPHLQKGAHGSGMRQVDDDSAANDWTIAQRLPLDASNLTARINAACTGGAERVVVTAAGVDTQADLATALRSALRAAAKHDTELHLDGGADAWAVVAASDFGSDTPLTYADPHLLRAMRHVPAEAELPAPLHRPSHPIIVDARLPHNAGLPMADELALTLGSWSQALATHGADAFAAGLPHRVLVSVDTSYFLEIAKLRAFRLLLPPPSSAS